LKSAYIFKIRSLQQKFMRRNFLYIHGLQRDDIHVSRKYLHLVKHFKDRFNYIYSAWINQTDFSKLLNTAEANLEKDEIPIIYGDSTGANFAYQLRERLKAKNKKSILILSSPLLNSKQRIQAELRFPEAVKKQMLEITSPENALVIASKKDQILQQNWLFEKSFPNLEVFEVDDNHQLSNYEKNSLEIIENYIDKNIIY